jgi:hypothetical protein
MIIILISINLIGGCTDQTIKENNDIQDKDSDISDDSQKEKEYFSKSSRIFGTWKNASKYQNNTTIISYTFYPDFTFSTYYFYEEKNMTGIGTWFIYDSHLSLTLSVVNETAIYDFEFQNNDTILILTDSQNNQIILKNIK